MGTAPARNRARKRILKRRVINRKFHSLYRSLIGTGCLSVLTESGNP